MKRAILKRAGHLALGTVLVLGSVNLGGEVLAQTDLKLAHFLPTANGMHKDFMEPWARALEACSGGEVKVTIYPGGTQLGNPAKLYDAVRAGAVDIAHGLSGLPGGRFERTRIAELPFIFDNADEATRTIWALFPDYLEKEFPGVKILGIHAHNPGQVHTTEKQVKTADDLQGLRLRFPTAATKSMIEALGGNPVGLPPGAVYENAEKGVIDGAVFTWDAMAAFNLAEVMKYHLDANAYVTTFWFGMNEKTYEGLSDKVKSCVDAQSGEALISKFGDWWMEWDRTGYERVSTGEGHEIIELSAAERTRWAEQLEPMIDSFIKDLEAKGVDDASEIYAKMKAMADAQE
ncbi:TRAP transporter substrate-binding protein [Labrenzia sp. CE80]|uniref:TRAP transporter substrate-binding protein n=1 Tax=Labrenzia sp. CE80 TaxID=1788986 RepID=UPI00129B8DF7|nr:TRAP transporter substrate-binding protein [Labrenzia sp. CE80]